MIQHISFISDHSYNLCEFCGESPYELKSTFTCNNGESMNTFYCYKCFFGLNTHINKSKPFQLTICNTEKCVDCDSPSVHKIRDGVNTNIYFCDNHISPHVSCIKISN